jgi:AcrR family transcriptional regulator
MSGKPGRPPEDRLLRQREIFAAVAPLILERGPRQLTMRQAASAACLSLGGLYHYFRTKRELVLHGVQPEAFARLCEDFYRESGHLEGSDPPAMLDAFLDFQIREIEFVRPAIHAALDIGGDAFWRALENGVSRGLEAYVRVLGSVIPHATERDLEALGRAMRRSLFAAMLDPSVTPDELRDELRSLADGSVGARPTPGAAPVSLSA